MLSRLFRKEKPKDISSSSAAADSASEHDIRNQISELRAISLKTLHEVSQLFALVGQRTARNYYPLRDGWGLTSLRSGCPFFVSTNDFTVTPWIIMGGHWEPNVDDVMMAYVKPHMRIADIGAHMGYYSVKFGLALAGTGRLYAFEPNPEIYPVCAENLKINGLDSIASLHKYALGDREETARLTIPESNMASANLVGDQEFGKGYDVKVVTLDGFLPENETLDLIKLDAEGFEPRILDGAKGVLSRSPDCALMVEVNLDRWQRFEPIEMIYKRLPNREAFAVMDNGSLKSIAEPEIAGFLQSRPFTECYFLICRADQIRS